MSAERVEIQRRIIASYVVPPYIVKRSPPESLEHFLWRLDLIDTRQFRRILSAHPTPASEGEGAR